MSTAGDIATETQRRLIGVAGKERLNSSNGALTTGTSIVTCNYPPDQIDQGVLLSVDYELMHVWHANGSDLSVERGMYGTTATSHGDGAIIEIEPRWPKGLILAELQRELQALPKSIFAVDEATVAFTTGHNVTDFTGMSGIEIHRLLQVLAWSTSSYTTMGVRTLKGTRLLRNMPTATFPSGYAIMLPDNAGAGADTTIRVTYAKDLDASTITDATDLQTGVGLPESAEDILVFGVAARLLMDHEAIRNDLARQGQQRHAEEVPPQAWLRTAQFYQEQRDRRIAEEGVRLLERWGYGER